VNRVATVQPRLTERSGKNQDQTKDQRAPIPPDRARRSQTLIPLRSAATGPSATSSDETRLHGMQKVRGSNPLSSTAGQRPVPNRGNRPFLYPYSSKIQQQPIASLLSLARNFRVQEPDAR
jgi:hypothetical protein